MLQITDVFSMLTTIWAQSSSNGRAGKIPLTCGLLKEFHVTKGYQEQKQRKHSYKNEVRIQEEF